MDVFKMAFDIFQEKLSLNIFTSSGISFFFVDFKL